uniref:Cerebellar degeneration related protein 2 n=1 Tax=Mustela putorius furo TaxID=9669 RepID=M3YZD8_MUSPF
DLQLAAELGKTLLDRNTELEDSLQQMYTTNQEQLQEIEMNYIIFQICQVDSISKEHRTCLPIIVQLARNLKMQKNQELLYESQWGWDKMIHALFSPLNFLQGKYFNQGKEVFQRRGNLLEQVGRTEKRESRHDFKNTFQKPCLQQLCTGELLAHFVYDHVFAEKITSLQSQQSPDEEENEHLKKTVTMLQAQLSVERQKRAAMEEEYGLVLKENSELEQQLGAADAYRARALELEAEVAEMRQMLQSEHPFVNGVEKLVPDSLFIPLREHGQSLLEEMLLPGPEAHRKPLKRSSSETVLSSLAGGDIVRGHEETCIRRARAVKQRGISLLHEVDTQYSALKVKYDELLKKCQQEEDSLSHKAVQTSRALARDLAGTNAQPEPGASSWEPASATPERVSSPTTTAPPEYKALFKQIFSCIKKTKQEIDEQRTKYRTLSSH